MGKPVDGQVDGCIKNMGGLMDGKITTDNTPCCHSSHITGWMDKFMDRLDGQTVLQMDRQRGGGKKSPLINIHNDKDSGDERMDGQMEKSLVKTHHVVILGKIIGWMD